MILACKNCFEVFSSDAFKKEFCCEYCYYEFYSPEEWTE